MYCCDYPRKVCGVVRSVRRLGKRKGLGVVLGSVLCGGVLCACGGSVVSRPEAVTPASSSSYVLTVESSPESSITDTFNPFVETGGPYGMGATGLIYEPLIQFDVAAPPKYYPWLATSYKWLDGGRKITFTIRRGVKWSNGTPFTPADVAFTYNLVRKYPAINSGGLAMTGVATSGDQVTLSFATAQYANLQQIANVPIVPKSVWSGVNPTTFVDPSPIGTGPYMLNVYTAEGFSLKPNPHYWQKGEPKVKDVYFPVNTSNTVDTEQLFSGSLVWAGNYIPDLAAKWVPKDPKYYHYWMAAGGSVSLEPNLKKWPLSVLAVRKAISLAVNRRIISVEGESGYEPPLPNASGLTLPTYKDWLASSVASMKLNPVSEVAAAKSVLEKAGFVLGRNGYFETKSGKVLSFEITDPTSYTDYAEDDALAAGELRKAGIDATFVGQTVGAWSEDVSDGDFQLTMHWSNGGITPYNEYEGWLNSALGGKSATGDYEGLNSPAMNADLARLATEGTVSAQTAALAPIEKFVAEELPVIPMVTSAAWCEYNSTHFVGWSSPTNPYESCQPAAPTNEVEILHLSPRR